MHIYSTILLLVLISVQTIFAQNRESTFHSNFEKTAFLKSELVPFELLLSPDPEMDHIKYTSIQDQYFTILDKAQAIRQKAKTTDFFLEKLFYTVHRKNLAWYENYVTFAQLLADKKYDCLTGTALLALLMEDLEIEYQILEFDFHIFLVVMADGRPVLMEATDPFEGFVRDADVIKARIEEAQNSSSVSDDYNKTQIMNSIDLVKLAGLQYYNLAVDEFNKGNYGHARAFIKKADILYPSERIKNTASLIVTSSL